MQGSPLAEASKPDVWPFVNGPHQWTPGTHKFFGWLAVDANMTATDAANDTPEEFFGNGFEFNETAQTLTIPSKQMTASTAQFDFMYSDIYTTEPINTPVQLEFRHLFSAVSFGIINDGSSQVRVTKFNVSLINTGGASLNYKNSDTEPTVTYTRTSTTASTFRSSNATITLDGLSNKPNAFNSSATEKEYLLMWPHTQSELSRCRINVSYRIGNSYYDTSAELSFPVKELVAGKRYHFDVSFVDKQTVQINYLVVDWDKIENEYTFE